MTDIYRFFNQIKNDKLVKIYEKSSKEISDMMNNIYRCAFRFNLTNKQTEYLLEEALQPFIGKWIEVK